MDATNTMIGGSNIGEGNVIANARNFHQGSSSTRHRHRCGDDRQQHLCQWFHGH
jgi:hypothetical protein